MKKMKFNTVIGRTVAAGCVVGLFMAAQAASACTLQSWSAVSGAVDPGGPNPDTTNNEVASARYSGFCAMKAAGEGFVQDNSPGGINRIRARFYVFNELAGGQSAQIFRGFSSTNGSGFLFTVTLNDAGQVVLRDNVANQTVSQTSATPWASVEIDWSQGSGDGVINLSVNGQTPDTNTALSNSGSPLEAVRLGNLNGASGDLSFDAYESRRTTAVGRVCPGDADPTGQSADFRDFADIDAIFVEFATLGGVPAAGAPDITEDGVVDFEDIDEVFRLFATLQGACPQ